MNENQNQNHIFAAWEDKYNHARRGQKFSLLTLAWCFAIPVLVFTVLYALSILGQLPENIVNLYVDYTWVVIIFCAILNITVMGFFIFYSIHIRKLLAESETLGKRKEN